MATSITNELGLFQHFVMFSWDRLKKIKMTGNKVPPESLSTLVEASMSFIAVLSRIRDCDGRKLS